MVVAAVAREGSLEVRMMGVVAEQVVSVLEAAVSTMGLVDLAACAVVLWDDVEMVGFLGA